MEQTRREFLEGRQDVLGGSDAGAIVGVSPWASPADVYDSKVMPIVDDGPPTPDQLRGILLEPVAVERWKEQTGRDCRKQPQRTHPDHDFIGANVDRQILADGSRGTGVLEVKCLRSPTFRQYKLTGLPEHIILQMQHYLGVYGYDYGEFCIFGADDMDLIRFEMERDDTVIKLLFEEEEHFWHDHVLAGVRPEEAVATEIEVPKYDGELLLTDDPAKIEALDNFFEARDMVKQAEEIKAMAHTQAVALFKDADAFDLPNAIVYHREQVTRRFNQALLKARFPLDGHVLRELLKDMSFDFRESPGEMDNLIQQSAIDLDTLKKPSTSRPFRPYPKKPEDCR